MLIYSNLTYYRFFKPFSGLKMLKNYLIIELVSFIYSSYCIRISMEYIYSPRYSKSNSNSYIIYYYILGD